MSFIQIDTNLLGSGLSPRAIICYGLCADRLRLSKVNGWIDDKGYYILFSYNNLAEMLNISRRRSIMILGELKAAGLIETIATRGSSNKIYVNPVPEGFLTESKLQSYNDIEAQIEAAARLERMQLSASEKRKVLDKILPNIASVKNRMGYIRTVLKNTAETPVKDRKPTYDMHLYDTSNAIIDFLNESERSQ